ncbi:MAG: PLP-dependent aminotransferase family protein [Clostridiales bacterium]|jgi:2-aminoadipate transaminase|nr:PLP-dependent aminotransferase family protein [Clostridiales bacterium]
MEYRFSKRIENIKPSAIREIFKYASDPRVVSLSAGNPSPDAFESEAIASICKSIFESRPIDALQYSVTEGYTPLREHMLGYMKQNHATGRDFDDILIMSGAQQIMEISAKILCNEGDYIICENPSFVGSLNSFRSIGTKLKGVGIENDGINIKELESALDKTPNVRIIYTIPNFQNPSGVTMSLEKRKALYELARKHDVMIIEDNPYGDLRYKGESIQNIKSFDDDGRVIYAGTFSKVIAPGLRVGYTIAPFEIAKKMVVAKQGEDVHSNILAQMICHEFLTKCGFDEKLLRLRHLYGKKAESAEKLLDKYVVPSGITYSSVEGGLFIWCRLPKNVDMLEFCSLAVREHGVAIVPGSAFMVDENDPCDYFRINFTAPSDERLEEGIKRLGDFALSYIP